MQSLAVDRETSAALGRAAEQVVILDEGGNPIGVFTPNRTASRTRIEISDEEIDQALNDPNGKWYTAAEVEARMAEIRRCSR